MYFCIEKTLRSLLVSGTRSPDQMPGYQVTVRKNQNVHLAPVVQRLDNAIHRINHCPVDSVVCFVSIYPLDSDLSGGQRYPAFEQPGPGFVNVNSTEKWTGMKNTGLKMPEEDQIYVSVGFSYYLKAKIIGKSFSILCFKCW